MLPLILCKEEQRKNGNKEEDCGSSSCAQICHKLWRTEGSTRASIHAQQEKHIPSGGDSFFLFPGQDKMPHGQPLTTKNSEFLTFISLLSCFLEILKQRHFLCYTMYCQTLDFSFPTTQSQVRRGGKSNILTPLPSPSPISKYNCSAPGKTEFHSQPSRMGGTWRTVYDQRNGAPHVARPTTSDAFTPPAMVHVYSLSFFTKMQAPWRQGLSCARCCTQQVFNNYVKWLSKIKLKHLRVNSQKPQITSVETSDKPIVRMTSIAKCKAPSKSGSDCFFSLPCCRPPRTHEAPAPNRSLRVHPPAPLETRFHSSEPIQTTFLLPGKSLSPLISSSSLRPSAKASCPHPRDTRWTMPYFLLCAPPHTITQGRESCYHL